MYLEIALLKLLPHLRGASKLKLGTSTMNNISLMSYYLTKIAELCLL